MYEVKDHSLEAFTEPSAQDTAQLASNVAAVDVVLPEGIEAELDALSEPPEQYWATRSGRPLILSRSFLLVRA